MSEATHYEIYILNTQFILFVLYMKGSNQDEETFLNFMNHYTAEKKT